MWKETKARKKLDKCESAAVGVEIIASRSSSEKKERKKRKKKKTRLEVGG